MKTKIKLSELFQLVQSRENVYIDTPSGIEKITDSYIKSGLGVNIFFNDGTSIRCAEHHLIWHRECWKCAKELSLGDCINGKTITKINNITDIQNWIDFTVDADHESYFHKGMLHHNSGKSLIIYSIIRYLIEQDDRPILLIVPNIGLVKQMANDFIDYSELSEYKIASKIQLISQGATKKISKPMVISTWQSLQSVLKDESANDYMNQFQAIIVDECHTAAAKVIASLMEAATNVKYRIGLTGTLSGAKTHEFVITGLFGDIVRVARTSDLIESGQVSKMEIRCIALNYTNKEEQKLMKSSDFQTEMMFLTSHPKRNKMLVDIALSRKGNTLMLFQFVERHGQVMYDLAKTIDKTGRKIFFIHGGVDGDLREEMRGIVEREDNALIIASYGVLGTGVSIKRLHNVIASSPTKSVIRLLQSMGRGLRLGEGKTHFTWYDVADKMYVKKNGDSNYTWKHFQERLRIYTEEGFSYKIIEKDI